MTTGKETLCECRDLWGHPWGGKGTQVVSASCPVHGDEDAWTLTYEKATPLYIGPLQHYTRRMLQALDGYWLHCDGLPPGRHPRGRYDMEDWWGRFEKYRALVEGQL